MTRRGFFASLFALPALLKAKLLPQAKPREGYYYDTESKFPYLSRKFSFHVNEHDEVIYRDADSVFYGKVNINKIYGKFGG